MLTIMVFRKFVVAHLLLFGAVELLSGVRVFGDQNDELWDGDAAHDDSDDACIEGLRTVSRTNTYTDLFSPIYNGEYMIRSKTTGKYLTGTEEGLIGTSLHHPSSKTSQWKLKRVKDHEVGVRKFTLQNKASGRFLVLDEGQLFSFKEADSNRGDYAAHWKLRRVDDGIHEVFESATPGNEAITENSSGFVTVMPYQGEKSEWFLDQQLSWWRIPASDSSGYKAQWKEAASIPMWPGANISWYQMCKDGLIKCDEAYGQLRMEYKETGILAESHRRIVQENILERCDVSWGFLQGVYSTSAAFAYAARRSGGEACSDRNLQNISNTMRRIAAEDCFDHCIAATTTELQDIPCGKRPDNVTRVMERVYGLPACSNLPPKSIVRIVEYTLVKRCATWPQSSPLFQRENHDWTSLTYYDGDEVCAIDSKSRNYKDIQQRGKCPSATTCQCPRTYLTTPRTAREMEYVGMSMLKDGDATLADEVWAQVTKNAKKVLISVLLRGSTVSAALGGLTGGLTFWPKIIWAAGGWAYRAGTWKCAHSVGCWPVRPARKKTSDTPKACRIPDEAKDGGSKVWFMPPPGVVVRHKKWYLFRRCEFRACERGDMMAEKVGFFKRDDNDKAEGKPNIYNCQRLGYEDMDPEQQRLYLERVRLTVPAEYTEQIRSV